MKEIILSLTGKNSHKIVLPIAQGSLSIGLLGMDKKKFDVLVDKDKKINWDAFNDCYTGSGSQHKDKIPYGDWPRFFYYYGNDTGFAHWTVKRETEEFTWVPQKSVDIDISMSSIRNLYIHSLGYRIDIKMGEGVLLPYQGLYLSGDLETINISECRKLFNFGLKLEKDTIDIPVFSNVRDIEHLTVSANVVGKPFDCKNLLQFKNVKGLSLSGNMINLDCLSEFKKLNRLALRQMLNLKTLPKLSVWDDLKSFIAVDIEKNRGKELRKELNILKKEREMDYSTVSKLRDNIWYTTEYGIPFTSWNKNSKKAIKKYKDSAKLLKKAENISSVKEIITDFTIFFNSFDNIETSEREDIGEAIFQLIEIPSFELDKKQVNEWFDLARDY